MLDPFISVIPDVFNHYGDINKELNQSVDDGAVQLLIQRFRTKHFWLEYTVRSSKFYVNAGMK